MNVEEDSKDDSMEDDDDVKMSATSLPSSSHDETTSGAQLLSPLLDAAASQDMSRLMILLQEKPWHGEEDISKWMDPLIIHLLSSSTTGDDESIESQQEQLQRQQQDSLWLVGALAKFQPDVYLLPIAKALSDRIDTIYKTRNDPPTITTTTATTTTSSFSISSSLLSVWIQQLTQTSQVAVHTYLLKALLQAIQMKGPTLAQPSMKLLMEIWDHHWENQRNTHIPSSERQGSSIVSVRCADIFISYLDALGDVGMGYSQQLGGTKSFSQMLQQSDHDPLLQLSILDLLSPNHFPTICCPSSSSVSQQYPIWPTSIRTWLISSEIVSPIMTMLEEDMLLAGPALQSASWLLSVANTNPSIGDVDHDDDDEEVQTMSRRLLHCMFHYIREQVGTTSNEADRLSVIHAMVQMATPAAGHSSSSSRATILQDGILMDRHLREAWWDMTRLSSPKLQAAILSSVGQVIQALAVGVQGYPNNDDDDQTSNSRIGLRIYTYLGTDNGIGNGNYQNTTDWLYSKYIRSPIPELRIAAYSIWEAVAALPSTNGMMTLSASQQFWNHMLLVDGGREMTSETRIAKYQVLVILHRKSQQQNGTNLLSKTLQTTLSKLIQLGPHGIKALGYDVMVE